MTDDSVTIPPLAVLGTGSMGRAILGGLVGPDRSATIVRATTRSRASAERLAQDTGVETFALEDDADANRRAVDGAGLVLLAVKPYAIVPVLEEVADLLAPGTLVVSVAAGITTAAMEAAVPESVPVVRAMPNTPATVGRGVTGVSAGSRAGRAELDLARAVFGCVGEVVEVPEAQLDALSTISGSGPAYVFYLVEALTAAAVDKGFGPEQAAALVNGTFRGAAELLAVSGREPGELRRQVTSPGGTTERALEVLAAGGLEDLFTRATDAALARARELGAG